MEARTHDDELVFGGSSRNFTSAVRALRQALSRLEGGDAWEGEDAIKEPTIL